MIRQWVRENDLTIKDLDFEWLIGQTSLGYYASRNLPDEFQVFCMGGDHEYIHKDGKTYYGTRDYETQELSGYFETIKEVVKAINLHRENVIAGLCTEYLDTKLANKYNGF